MMTTVKTEGTGGGGNLSQRRQEDKPTLKPWTPKVWKDKRPPYSGGGLASSLPLVHRSWSLKHDNKDRNSCIPPCPPASMCWKCLSYWIPVTGTDAPTDASTDRRWSDVHKNAHRQQEQNVQMHFLSRLHDNQPTDRCFKCKAISTSISNVKHFFQCWFSVLFGKYVSCYEHFSCLQRNNGAQYSIKPTTVSACLEFDRFQLRFICFHTNI